MSVDEETLGKRYKHSLNIHCIDIDKINEWTITQFTYK
jgi:hypothetical protein